VADFHIPEAVVTLADHLAALPGVVAVTFRDDEPEHVTPERWALGLYSRGRFDRNLLGGVEGIESVNVESSLDDRVTFTYDDSTVALHLRDYDEVLHWLREAEQGRFEVHTVAGHQAGRPTYSLAAELALDRILAGSIDPAVGYPHGLSDAGADHWRRRAARSLERAESRAGRGDVAGVHGHLFRAALETAHARLCEARAWTRNEKEILERAELTHLTQILTALNTDPVTLAQRVMQARALLLD
jgi:hypothetical protein